MDTETLKGLLICALIIAVLYKLCRPKSAEPEPETEPEQEPEQETESEPEQEVLPAQKTLTKEERQRVCDAAEPAVRQLAKTITERKNAEQLHAQAVTGGKITVGGGGLYTMTENSEAVQKMLAAQVTEYEKQIVEQMKDLQLLIENPPEPIAEVQIVEAVVEEPQLPERRENWFTKVHQI